MTLERVAASFDFDLHTPIDHGQVGAPQQGKPAAGRTVVDLERYSRGLSGRETAGGDRDTRGRGCGIGGGVGVELKAPQPVANEIEAAFKLHGAGAVFGAEIERACKIQAAGFRLEKEEAHHSFGQDLVGQIWALDLDGWQAPVRPPEAPSAASGIPAAQPA